MVQFRVRYGLRGANRHSHSHRNRRRTHWYSHCNRRLHLSATGCACRTLLRLSRMSGGRQFVLVEDAE